ncbi:NAD/NADP-dependent betaine aldehyde dehydrogenase [Halioglobus japonicus]|nr:NAD/NADP-dependent betaine aldehyde dehydrogenase [Halioglobus japonicus]
MKQTTTARDDATVQHLPSLFNYIDGDVVEPVVDRGNNLKNPNDLTDLQAQKSASDDQLQTALAAADRAHQQAEWENVPAGTRADILDTIADRLDNPEIAARMAYADAVTTGAVIQTTRLMAQLAPFVYRASASYLRTGALEKVLPGKLGDVSYLRRPWGPALLVVPWNGPTAIGSHKIASALAAGAPCIIKPSEWAPHSALVMAEVIQDCDLPQGTFQLVCGNRDLGSKLVSDERIKAISFTGGTAGGRAIAHACADSFRPTQLELGGNNPLVVFEDADLELAAEGIVYGLSNLNAQWCRALGRLLVHSSVKERLLELVAERLGKLKLGDSLDPTSEMGPLIHEQQYRSILSTIEQLQSSGGKVLQFTAMPDLPGYFVPPTLIDGCAPEHTIEEMFGPVACIHTFDTDAQALALANGTPFGLAAYVYSRNEARARHFSTRLRTGGVKINGYSLLSLSPDAPRGAWGLSGLGEEGTAESIEFFTGARVIGVSPQDKIIN